MYKLTTRVAVKPLQYRQERREADFAGCLGLEALRLFARALAIDTQLLEIILIVGVIFLIQIRHRDTNNNTTLLLYPDAAANYPGGGLPEP